MLREDGVEVKLISACACGRDERGGKGRGRKNKDRRVV